MFLVFDVHIYNSAAKVLCVIVIINKYLIVEEVLEDDHDPTDSETGSI